MTLHIWWLFTVAVFFLSATPGPNMLYVMSTSVRYGVIKSISAMAGCGLAVVSVLVASAAGMSSVLMASPRLYEFLRYAGVAYLFYLGLKACFSKVDTVKISDSNSNIKISGLAIFRGGVAIGLSNPKSFIFAASFFPQFVNQNIAQLPQLIVLISTFAIVEMMWYIIYASGGHKLSQLLNRPNAIRIFNGFVGIVFISFALMLLLINTTP